MKNGFLLAFGFMVMATCFAQGQQRHQVISKDISRGIVKHLNNICGDTFCEGDFTYDFRSMECIPTVDGDECELSFKMTTTNFINLKSDKVEARTKVSTLGSCVFSQIRSQSEVLDENKEFTSEFSDELMDCLGALEKNLSK